MSRVLGPLYYERTGRKGPVMAFMPPNPMDQACWTYQMQHFSTWCRCIAIDTPGYGRSPSAEDDVTYEEICQAFWDAIDEVEPTEKVILVGCSGSFMYALGMQHLHPDRTAAVILSGAGWTAETTDADTGVGARLAAYEKEGIAFRYRHIFLDFSPSFNATPMARYIADVFLERNSLLDVETIKRQYKALAVPDPDPERPEGVVASRPRDSVLDVQAPTLILTGTEDASHLRSFLLQEKIKGSELKILPGAGHACQIEQPWLFDTLLIAFLEKHGIIERAKPAV